MVWKLIVNKPLNRFAFRWDGTQHTLSAHFTQQERERLNLKVVGSGRDAFVMLNTLHGPSCTKPGDWLVKVTWPSGTEVYSVKDEVFRTAYTVVGEKEI